MSDKKKIALSIIAVLALVLGIIGVSYAAFTYSRTGEKVNTITTGTISMEYQESSNVISISNALPTTDATGKVRLNSGEYFDFTVITNISGNANINWEIAAEDLDDSTFSGTNIKYYLTRLDGSNEVEVMAPRTYVEETVSNEVTGRPSNMMSLLSGVTATTGRVSTNYRLRLYVDEKYNPQHDQGSLVYKTRINVYGKVREDNRLASKLIRNYTNNSSITAYNDGDKTKMYTFQQPKRTQQIGYTEEELTEYRYIGNTPNNYITFNDELWRIIGVFTVEDKEGNKEQRVKIIREETIGSYSIDATRTTEYGEGKNRWDVSVLMKVLNPGYENTFANGGSSYWNKENKTCPLGNTNDPLVNCDFRTTGLKEEAKSQIEETKWYLGGDAGNTSSVQGFHYAERGTTIYDSQVHPGSVYWVGEVGLMYASDYGYTYGLGVDTICYGRLSFCKGQKGAKPAQGWLYKNENHWTMTPTSSNLYGVYLVYQDGYVEYERASYRNYINPVVFLKSSISLLSGTGTSSDPFSITLQ